MPEEPTDAADGRDTAAVTDARAAKVARGDQPGEWKLWPPSPKMQILLIAAVFGLINLCLLAIWAYVMYRRFG